MSDAVSTIGLGINTGTGKKDLDELRLAFAGLKTEVRELNDLRANAQGVTGGLSAAKNEIATLSAELRAASSRIGDLENQLKGFSNAQVNAVRATAATVKSSVEAQAKAVIDSEKHAAEETQRLARETTKVVQQESLKRASTGSSAKYGGVSYSYSEKIDPNLAQTSIIKSKLDEQARLMKASDDKRLAEERSAQAAHDALMLEGMVKDQAYIQGMLQAHAEFQAKKLAMESEANAKHLAMSFEMMLKEQVALQSQLEKEVAMRKAAQERRDVTMAAAGSQANLQANAEAYRRTLAEQDQEYKLYLQRQRDYAARQRELEGVFRQADLDAERAKLKGQEQEYKLYKIKQAEHLREWREIEALIAKDEKEAQRIGLLAQNQQYQEYLARNRAYAQREAELTQAMRKAEEQEYKLHLLRQAEAQAEFNAKRSGTILNNNFNSSSLSSQVNTTRRAAGLINNGEAGLANQLYGSEAVKAVGNLSEMEKALAASKLRGSDASRQATQQQRVHTEAMRDAHSAARGLAGGLGQLWVTYGSIIPLVAGAAVTGSLVKVFSAGKDVEYQLQFLRALADDVEKRPIDLDGFLRITDGTMASVKDAASGMRALAQAGLDQQKALVALPNILDLAAIGELSVGAAALSATGIVHAFNLEMNDIGHVGDVFAKVASSSNTSIQGMTESMKSASTVGELFHVKMEEAAASIGVLAQRNIIGTSAGTALTTALKNLYEPTAKAAAALKQMGITTDDGHGGLKNYTQLLEELRVKLSGLSDASRAVFLGTITDQRGAKAISAITSNLKEYKQFLDDANNSTGFMSKATLELEDTVQGSFQRMSNAVEGTFLQAFKQASPTIREVIADLTDFGKSETAINFISRLAVAAANLTKTFIENAGTIAAAVGVYASLKILSTAVNGYVALKTAVATYTLTAKAATVATETNSVALTIQQQASLAAGRGMIVAGTAARFLTASLGPISIILLGLVTAYELYNSKVKDSDNSMKAANNTADTVLEYYDRQIAKLRELNKELTDFSEKGSKAANDTAKAVLQAQFLNKSVEITKLEKNGGGNRPTSYKDKALVGDYASTELDKAKAELKEIGDKLLNLDTKSKEMQAEQGLNKKLNDKKGVETRLEALIRDAGGDEADPAGNAATKLMVPKILKLKDELKSSSQAYISVAQKIVEYRQELNEKLGTYSAPNKKGNNDAYRAAQADLDGDIQRIKDLEKSSLSDVKSKLAASEIGDLQAIAQNLEIVKKARADELVVLAKKRDMAQGEEKKAASQQIKNKQESNIRADAEASKDADRDRRELLAKWQIDNVKSEAESYKKKGDLVHAYLAEYESKYKETITRLDKDIADPKTTKDQVTALTGRKSFLKDQFDSGRDAASFEQTKQAYEEKLNEMRERLASVAEKNARTNESARSPGFLSDLGAAEAADDIRNEALPALEDLVGAMSNLAEKSKDSGMKSSVAAMGTELIKEANRSRDAWIAAGKSIEKSLSESFGKGGKAAGGLISTLIKQRETQKGIDDDLRKQKADKDNQDPIKQLALEDKAREQSAQLQLSTYGDIAGAAKGFFDEHSKGYAVMQTAEKTFRAFELAASISSFAMKSGFLTAFTGLFASSKATEVGLQAATVGPTIATEGAKQGAYGVTALAAALTLPFPANIPAYATVAAMLAAIGVAVSGGGGGSTSVDTAKERQKYNGTGHTYQEGSNANPYDWELEKSESLSKSLEAMKDNSDIALKFSSSQLAQLTKISEGISGLSNLVIQTSGIRGTRADELALGVGSSKSFLGFSSSKTELQDSGIVFDRLRGYGGPLSNTAQTVGSVMNNGVQAHTYADTKTTSKSWFGLSKDTNYSTALGSLDSALTDQMSSIIKSLYDTVHGAAQFLGRDNATLESSLKGVTLQQAGLDKLSLKGLSSEQVEKELNAAFSNLGDILAKTALPGIEQFKKASEGYLTTLVRVSAGVDQASYTLDKLGVKAVAYTEIINKQGDVASEIVRSSLVAQESIKGLTGIGEIIKGMTGSADELADAYSSLVKIRSTMKLTGVANADVTTNTIRGAGGLDKLATGVDDFLENFFSEAEKAAAKSSLLGEEFEKLGKPMPKTKEEFKQLIQSIDQTSASGQTLYGALISLSGQFSELADDAGVVNPALVKQRAVIAGLIQTAEHWLDVMKSSKELINDIDTALSETGKVDNSGRIKELQELLNSGSGNFEQQLEIAGELKDLVLEKYQTEKANAQDLIKFGKQLTSYVTDLKTGDLSPLTNKGKLEAAAAAYQETLLNSTSSDKDIREEAQGQLQDRANTYLDLAHTYYASSQSYTDIFKEVTDQLGHLGISSIEQGKSLQDIGQDQVKELLKLRDLAKGIQDQAKSEYDATVTHLANEIRLLQDMAEGLGALAGIPGLLKSMPAELALALGAKGVTSGSGGSNGTIRDEIESLYQALLHRKADDAGLNFWVNGYQKGLVSMEQIRQMIIDSQEYRDGIKGVNGSHANGLDYVPFDGYVAELHRGERVLTEAEARRTDKAAMASTQSFSSVEKAEMAAEIAQLRGTVERLIEAHEQGTRVMVNAMHASTSNAAEQVVQGSKDAASSSDYDKRNRPAYQ